MTRHPRWWIGPVLAGVITLPALALDGLLLMMWLMAYSDECPATANCVQTDHHLLLGTTLVPVAGMFWVASLLAAKKADLAVRVTLCLLAPVAAVLSLVSIWTIPVGR